MTDLRADPGAALEFLLALYPDGPWALCAINPRAQRDDLHGRTFGTGDVDDLLEWVIDHNARQSWNVYYHVNPLRRHAYHAKLIDVARVCYLHVDVDPRSREDFDEERVRIRDLFGSRRPADVPAPTFLVDSGGGYNALWRLEVPIELDGSLEAAEAAGRYNQQIEWAFGADPCHDVSRILRLPGTVNYPNATKIKRGRVPCGPAALVLSTEATYSIARFKPAPVVATPAPGAGAAQASRTTITGNLPPVNLRDLPDTVTDRTKALIVQGTDVDDPGKFGTRSECVWHVACQLVRDGCTDDQIYGILTNPAYSISESVLTAKGGAHRYACRQIDRARLEAVNPHMVGMNDRHAVIGNLGGRCVVIEEQEEDGLNRTRLTFQTFGAIRERYLNVYVDVGEDAKGQRRTKPLGDYWLSHPQRQQYDRITFSPRRDVERAYNLWRGFDVEPRPGDCSLWLDHVLEVGCSGDRDAYEYLIRWMARAVQHPDSRGEVAVVLGGRMGTGKGTIATEFGKLFGRHFMAVSNPRHLVGNFNGHLLDCVVLFADEAFFAGDKQHSSVLKTLITEQTLPIEIKHRDVFTAANYLHVLMASNNNWIIPAGPDERRYLVLDVSSARMGDRGYWERIRHQLYEQGGREALLHHLLHLDLSGWEHRSVPITSALRNQKALSLPPEEEWWYRKLDDGILLDGHDHWTAPVAKRLLYEDYRRYAQEVGVTRRANDTILGRFIKRVAPDARDLIRVLQVPDERGRMVRQRATAYQFPELDACRRRWDGEFGKVAEWPSRAVEGDDNPGVPF